ncbi:MAG: acyl-CoA dehydrogenase family protein [Xanthobacteraceae bacterium]|nr:acyl-CoA dehydrogenase family protein [Xanthobacteraceae bacterium]MCW5678215.1 acyl-CoA dehydrogenase family protein [Xanthobacteraceae bacterium]
MAYELNEEQTMFARSVRGFAEKNLAASALERAHNPGFPFDIAKLMAQNGLLGITLPEEDGGQGGTPFDAIIAIDEVAQVCPRSADVIQAGNFGPIRTFSEFATEDQKQRFLPSLLAGTSVISLCMSEPEAGSAATELKARAEHAGNEIIINGTKVFSTHSADALVYLVYVRFGPGIKGIGAVLVERDAPGLQVGRPSSFMNGEQWCQLYFENCRVSEKNLLLGPGGFKNLISGFNVERLGNSARSLALGKYAFNTARQHALVRRQFGRELCEFQGIQWKFADMATRLEAAELLLQRAANSKGADGLPDGYSTAMAKMACNEAGHFVTNEALQIMGATGFSQEALVEYCVRRTRGWMIAGGSIEMLKNRIAENVFGRRFSQRGDK